jgi:hypothetical protein
VLRNKNYPLGVKKRLLEIVPYKDVEVVVALLLPRKEKIENSKVVAVRLFLVLEIDRFKIK